MANIVAKHLDEASETQAMVETAAGKGSGRYRYYRDMWLDIADEFGPFEKIGKNSLGFKKEEGLSEEGVIRKVFAIPDEKARCFAEAFDRAVGRNGREKRRILSLRSSALCALLHFYDRKGETLLLPLGGDRFLRLVVEEADFEVKNPVFKAPSNVDVLLKCKDEGGRAVLVYLESKFSEYIDGFQRKCACSRKYCEEGVFEPLRCLRDEIAVSLKGEKSVLESKERRYLGGLKQMCAHLRGIKNGLESGELEGDVYLGCIVLPIPGKELDAFRKDYQRLARHVNENQDFPRLRLIPDLLSYKEGDFRAHEPKTRCFYGEE